MSGNSGAWGIAMWKDGHGGSEPQAQGISLEGGDPIVPYLPTEPLGSLLVPPAGLGVPAVRSGDVAFAQRDGVVQFADYYEARQITLQVLIKNDGCPGCPGARQKVARLTQEWSRNCSGATLLIFSDCHDPDATEEEKIALGPYLVHGRPRVADVVWERSNRGVARVTLRFDAADAQLLLADTPDGSPWNAQHTTTVDTNENLAPDPDLSGLTMTLNGATVEDSHFTQGGPAGPDGGPYFSRFIVAPNTTSPMTMALSPSGLGGIPVVAGQSYTISYWARKEPAGGPASRVDLTWYNAAGATITSVNGAAASPTATWARFSQTFVAPALATFLQPRLSWTGTALAGQSLEFAQAWVNQGVTATGPGEIEVVGTLCVYPVITLFPHLTAPIVVTYGNHQFTYGEDVTDPITIDTRWGRASEGTLDVTENVSGDYSSPLEPGVHAVMVQSASPADDGFAVVEWANAVVSG